MNLPKRDDIAREIGNCFSKTRPEKEKLYRFADELLKNLNPQVVIDGKVTLPSPIEWGKTIQSLSDETRERNWEDREELKKFIKKTEKFYGELSVLKHKLAYHSNQFLYSAWTSHHQNLGDLTERDGNLVRVYKEDDEGNQILLFPEKMEIFEKYLHELHMMLQLELKGIPAKGGRPENNQQQDFLSLLYVMTECLLETKAGISNSTTPFRRIVEYSLSLVGEELKGNFPYIMSFCSDDYLAVKNMAYKYKEYSRLDLFIEHVLETEFENSFCEEFADEWADWERPSNFSKLSCSKNA